MDLGCDFGHLLLGLFSWFVILVFSFGIRLDGVVAGNDCLVLTMLLLLLLIVVFF